MGYLSPTTLTVTAILTRLGRERLAKNAGFTITQFAASDDEVDYSLYTTSHPLGSNFYGSIIENMPVLEPSPDETQSMRYKLVTLPRGTSQIPIITVGFNSITLTAGQSAAVPIRPTTTNGLNGPGFGYTAVLYNSDAAVLVGTGLPANVAPTAPSFLGDTGTLNSVVSQGLEFSITPKNVTTVINTQITIIGSETGASITLPITVNPAPQS